MAVQEFSKRFSSASVTRPRLRSERTAFERIAHAIREVQAAEADPMNGSEGDDALIPAEHEIPALPAMGEENSEETAAQLRHVDPQREAEEPREATAALHDELAQSTDVPEEPPAEMMADGPPGSDEGKPRDALPEADKAQTGQVPVDEQHMQQPAPPGTPPAPQPEPAPATPQAPVPAPAQGEDSVFDFVNGLEPVDRGKLVNDWQEAVDNKLFSRHTNVFHIDQHGNNCILTVQAYNTDSGTQPSVQTGYAVDGVERGELMGHLREVFQPNGPAVTHVANVYNGFIEKQADLGRMHLMRLKVVQSQFKFTPDQRSIEGWADGGLGKEPQWRKTPYTVYTVQFTLTFSTIGQGAQQQAQPPAPQPGAA